MLTDGSVSCHRHSRTGWRRKIGEAGPSPPRAPRASPSGVQDECGRRSNNCPTAADFMDVRQKQLAPQTCAPSLPSSCFPPPLTACLHCPPFSLLFLPFPLSLQPSSLPLLPPALPFLAPMSRLHERWAGPGTVQAPWTLTGPRHPAVPAASGRWGAAGRGKCLGVGSDHFSVSCCFFMSLRIMLAPNVHAANCHKQSRSLERARSKAGWPAEGSITAHHTLESGSCSPLGKLLDDVPVGSCVFTGRAEHGSP